MNPIITNNKVMEEDNHGGKKVDWSLEIGVGQMPLDQFCINSIVLLHQLFSSTFF